VSDSPMPVAQQPAVPPSPFYRVSAKVIILDNQNRVLVMQNDRGDWEMPGGGLEHDESVEECIERELLEEAGVRAKVGQFRFMYRALSTTWGYMALRLVFAGKLVPQDQRLVAGSDMHAVRFATRAEFTQLRFASSEEPILGFADDIFGTAVE